ncbi:fibrinogen-like protein 1-like protein [Lingula anatina]|uniref:Fibrinogen-like protein 1-like protein n=1 Tax=Lingula anatina TaxID=7574 RepID=A0A1S3K937_LINAN|nr:fibrinogen-like protein 1-like protein [Lingula anatina]|eukprot:XP_013419012.1 fibrinogen-like protein 1-like protein [Lingula anatina]
MGTWSDYRNGFGDLESDHWLGLEAFHHLTNQGNYSLMTEVRDNLTSTYFSDIHVDFRVGPEKEGYILYEFPLGDGNLTSSAEDQWYINYDMMFSAYDKDQDTTSTSNCAATFGGGWWYRACTLVSLTGQTTHCTSGCYAYFKHNGVPFGGNGSDDILLNFAVMKIKKIG